MLWAAFGALLIASFVIGLITGNRADEIAGGLPDGEVASNQSLRSLLLTTLGATTVVGIAAFAVTLVDRLQDHMNLVLPSVLIAVGIVVSFASLLGTVVVVAGVAVLVFAVMRSRKTPPAAGRHLPEG